jgi:hypothetical protein
MVSNDHEASVLRRLLLPLIELALSLGIFSCLPVTYRPKRWVRVWRPMWRRSGKLRRTKRRAWQQTQADLE